MPFGSPIVVTVARAGSSTSQTACQKRSQSPDVVQGVTWKLVSLGCLVHTPMASGP